MCRNTSKLQRKNWRVKDNFKFLEIFQIGHENDINDNKIQVRKSLRWIIRIIQKLDLSSEEIEI